MRGWSPLFLFHSSCQFSGVHLQWRLRQLMSGFHPWVQSKYHFSVCQKRGFAGVCARNNIDTPHVNYLTRWLELVNLLDGSQKFHFFLTLKSSSCPMCFHFLAKNFLSPNNKDRSKLGHQSAHSKIRIEQYPVAEHCWLLCFSTNEHHQRYPDW